MDPYPMPRFSVAVSDLERFDRKPERIDELIARRRSRRLAMTVGRNVDQPNP